MYFLFILLIVLCYVICYIRFNRVIQRKRSFLTCCFFIMLFMQWFRDISIYPDIDGYEGLFYRAQDNSNLGTLALFDGGYELGWYVLNFIFSRIFDKFDYFLKFVGFAVTTGYIYGVYKYSEKTLFSILFILVYPSAFGMSFYVLKQSLALSVILYAIHFLNEDKLKGYLLTILIAISFHYSAIIFLPLYWIKKNIENGFSIKLVAIILLFVIGISRLVSLVSLNNLAGDKYDEYLTSGGNLLPLLLVSFVAFIFIVKRRLIYGRNINEMKIQRNEYINVIISYCMLGVIICVCIYGTRMDRMALYFTNFLAISVPQASSLLPRFQSRLFCSMYLLFSLFWVIMSDDYCDINHFDIKF